MWQILIGSILLSAVHALIPNHWLPLIAISRSEKWSIGETVNATLISGLAHTLSTVIIGVVIGFAGIRLSQNYAFFTRIAAPVILFLMGATYLIIGFKHHHHHFDIHNDKAKNSRSKVAIILSLSVAMFFSPCFEIEAYFFQASLYGWAGVLLVSSIYVVATPAVMSVFVALGLKGIQHYNFHFLEHNEKQVVGIILILLAVLSYFVQY